MSTLSLPRSDLDNFNPGPAALPQVVIEAARRALVEVKGGPGILELSHRSDAFAQIIEDARAQITLLYNIPSSHEVLFMQGGASLQFALLPLNLGARGGFITTGEWSRRALAEAQIVGGEGQSDLEDIETPRELWSSESDGFREVPHAPLAVSEHELSALRYLHLTSNNTIYGTQYTELPTLTDVHSGRSQALPYVVDASSDVFSRPLDWSRIGLLYAGAQKNAGPSGVTLVIGRRDLLRAPPRTSGCPKILRYQTHAEKGSLYHTPNTLGIFMVGEVARWAHERGGLNALHERAQRRASALYEVIDAHPDVFQAHAKPCSRSLMNVTFRGASADIEARLLERAQAAQMIGLKGHRLVGGLRASLYNAVRDESVERLIALIADVAREVS